MGNAIEIDTHKLFKQILTPMIVSINHLFKIYQKAMFGNPALKSKLWVSYLAVGQSRFCIAHHAVRFQIDILVLDRPR